MTTKTAIPEPAIIEISSCQSGIEDRKLTGTICERQAKALTVVTAEEIAALSSVRVQCKNLLSFGEVLQSVPDPNTMWTIHISVKRSILIV